MASSRVAEVSPARADSATDVAVRLESVTRLFGLTPGLVRVNLAVGRGEALLVQGPNGAGKTTLLRVIATALAPTYGRGAVLGHDLGTGREEIRRRTELLGHRTRLYEELTAVENLRFVCAIHRLPTAAIPAALERVGLARVAGQRTGGYSRGPRQRLAVARAILRRPELLLLDDPYAGLDPDAREVVDAVVEEARTEGRTVIVTSHDPSAAALATGIVRMEGGRLIP